MTTSPTTTTDRADVTDVTDVGLWAEPADRPATGSGGGRWHAVERTVPPRAGEGTAVRAFAMCGEPVTVAVTFSPFDDALRDRDPGGVCLECVWTVAVRTGTESHELAWLRAHDQPLVAAAAAAILTAADTGLDTAGNRVGSGHGRDHPATVQLLTVVAAHAPVKLVDLECTDQCCDHRPDPCPVTATACPVCSVRAGGWAGEMEGIFEPECTIPSPCEVLRTLAGHFGVSLPVPAPPS